MKTIGFLIAALFFFFGSVSQAQQVSPLTEINTVTAEAIPGKESVPVSAEEMKGRLFPTASFPFNQTGFINYLTPKNFKRGSILIVNSKGDVVKAYGIEQPGEGYITVFGGTLMPGTYFYSLVINGEITEKRKLVITH